MGTAPVRVLATLAIKGAMPALLARFGQDAQQEVEVEFSPTNVLLGRIAAGEAADLAILTRQAVVDLTASGTLRPGGADLAVSEVGIAVRAGAARPDIGTVPALVAALRAARSVVYSAQGASGVYFAGLLDRLGIAAEVNAKATIIPTGLTAEPVARGEAELAVQQLSELRAVPGVDIVAALPAELNSASVFTAALFSGSVNTAANGFLRFLAGAEAAPILAQSGLRPCHGAAGTSSAT